MSLAVVFCTLLIIDDEGGEVWNVKAMNLRNGNGSIGVYSWSSSTQSEVAADSSDNIHCKDMRQISCFFPVSARYSSLYIAWGTQLLPPKYRF